MSEGKCRLSALVIRFFSLNGGEPATAGAAVPTKLDPCVQVLVLGDRQQDQGAHYEHCTRPVSKHCTRVQTLHPCPNIAPMSEHQHVANTSTPRTPARIWVSGLGHHYFRFHASTSRTPARIWVSGLGHHYFRNTRGKGWGGGLKGAGVSVSSAWVCLTTCRVWGERRRRAKWGLGGEGVEIASCRAQS